MGSPVDLNSQAEYQPIGFEELSANPSESNNGGRRWGRIALGVGLAVVGVALIAASIALIVLFPPSVLVYVSATGVGLFLAAKILTGGAGLLALIAAGILCATSGPKKESSPFTPIDNSVSTDAIWI